MLSNSRPPQKRAEPPQPGNRASTTNGRSSTTGTLTKLAEVDLCWLNLNFGLYYKLDSMKTWENCNRTLFLLPHLGKGQTPKEHVFCQTPGLGLGVDFFFCKKGAEAPQPRRRASATEGRASAIGCWMLCTIQQVWCKSGAGVKFEISGIWKQYSSKLYTGVWHWRPSLVL